MKRNEQNKDIKNSVEVERTVGAIAMRSSGNLQGGYRFLNLKIKRVLNRHHFTVCPITNEVIRRVHQLANRDGVLTDEEEFLHGNNQKVVEGIEENDPPKEEYQVEITKDELPEIEAQNEADTTASRMQQKQERNHPHSIENTS